MFSPLIRSRLLLAGLVLPAVIVASCSSEEATPSAGPATSTEQPAEPADEEDECVEVSPVRVALQPISQAWPYWLANELGYFTDNCLEYSVTIFDSGPPLVEAGLAGEWDAAVAGTPPALTGASTWGVVIGGLPMEEAGMYNLYVRSGEVDLSNPVPDLQNGDVLLTINSSGHLAYEACMAALGLGASDMNLVPLPPAGIIAGFDSGSGKAFITWPPNSFRLEAAGAVPICNAGESGVEINNTWIMAPTFWNEQRVEAVALMEALFRAGEFVKDNPGDAAPLLEQYFLEIGITLSSAEIEREITERTWRSLTENTEYFRSGKAKVALKQTSDFFEALGIYATPPDLDLIVAQSLEVSLAAEDYRASRSR